MDIKVKKLRKQDAKHFLLKNTPSTRGAKSLATCYSVARSQYWIWEPKTGNFFRAFAGKIGNFFRAFAGKIGHFFHSFAAEYWLFLQYFLAHFWLKYINFIIKM